MSVFRVEKNKGYTVMSNHHLRNHTLSLKAKGLLSQMLSLPEDWDYTLQGLAQINKESIDAIREAVRELERAGYIERSRERDERGCLRGTVYTIYEQPHMEPTPKDPAQALPTLDHPALEKPMLDKPTLENPMQLNTKGRNKEKRNTDQSITDSIPFPSGFPDAPTQKRTETKEAFDGYRDLILENIDYDILADDPRVDHEQLDEIVELVQETVCSTRSRIRVAGSDYPAEVVRAKLLKLNSEHIRFVMDCLKQNTTRIRNIRQYLLAALFNAPSTMNSYRRTTDPEYRVEMVTPKLTYDEMEKFQECVRRIRQAGGKVNESCGMHVHVDASNHNRQSLKNLLSIMYSKEDLLFKALKTNPARVNRWCQRVREPMLQRARRLSNEPTTDLTQLENIWYEGCISAHEHYNWTRYYALNLHSVFYRGTIEWRCFNSTLHAGRAKAYVNLCLAMSAQAIAQRTSVMRKTVSDNELFTFRVWLVRMGLNGDEFKNTRDHLLANLEGDRAWRYDKDCYASSHKNRTSQQEQER